MLIREKVGLISAAKAASLLRMDVKSFRRLTDKGVVTKANGAAYDPDKVLDEYLSYIKAVAGGHNKRTPDGIDPDAEKARKDKEMADRIALQNAITRGEQAPVSYFKSALTDAFSRFRAKLIAAPSKLAPVLEGMDRVEIREALKKVIDEALNELMTDAFEPEVIRGKKLMVRDIDLPEGDDDE